MKGCPKGQSLFRVRSDNGKTPSYVRQGCSGEKLSAGEQAFFELIERAAKP